MTTETATSDPRTLDSKLLSTSDFADLALPDDVALLHGMIRELLQLLKQNEGTLAGVQHRLDLLLRRLYGPKSERFRPDQPLLFDDPPDETTTEPTVADQPAPKPRRSAPHGRRRLPDDLKRERLVHDLPEAEKICPCCQQLRTVLGEQTSEQLDYRPAKLFVRQHVRLTYGCHACMKAAVEEIAHAPDPADTNEVAVNALDPTATSEVANASAGIGSPEASDPPPLIVTAPKPPQLIDKGLPGPGLLAYVITSKYADHLPLYRQEAILARHGVELARSTLSNWMAAVAEALTPLYALMLADVLKSRVVQMDETRLPVQEAGQDKTKSGRLWVYVGDRDHPFLVYDYTPTKERDGPAKILEDYRGFLQADAANVFDGFYQPDHCTEVACWAHARRYFHEARTSDPARSAEALARIRAFYDVEDKVKALLKKQPLGEAEADALRHRYRQEMTKPLLASFAEWIEREKSNVLPKSPMGQAIGYAQRQWQALQRFTTEGFLNIDNNASERALRPVAVGRKNWLFAGSDQGGRTAAVLFSFTQTCKEHKIDPYAYLQDLFTQLPSLPPERLPELFPHTWAQSQRQSA